MSKLDIPVARVVQENMEQSVIDASFLVKLQEKKLTKKINIAIRRGLSQGKFVYELIVEYKEIAIIKKLLGKNYKHKVYENAYDVDDYRIMFWPDPKLLKS